MLREKKQTRVKCKVVAMICDKGSFTYNIKYEMTIREQRERIKQLEDFIRKNNLLVPQEIYRDPLRGGYNTDDEE